MSDFIISDACNQTSGKPSFVNLREVYSHTAETTAETTAEISTSCMTGLLVHVSYKYLT